MSDTIKHIVRHLHAVKTMQDIAKKANLCDAIYKLQDWQCKRLIVTHDDLWQNPKYRPGIQFFVDELYGPKDFSQRDEDIARVVPKMANILPEKALYSLSSALHLNALSYELDFAMVKALDGQSVDHQTYAEAYRQIDKQTARAQQIDYFERLGNDLADVVKIRGIAMLLKLSRKPASIAGVLSLHEFLEKGFNAFKQIGDITEFISPIVQRERTIMIALLDGDNPLPDQL